MIRLLLVTAWPGAKVLGPFETEIERQTESRRLWRDSEKRKNLFRIDVHASDDCPVQVAVVAVAGCDLED